MNDHPINDEQIRHTEELASAAVQSPTSRPLRILVVDDQSLIRQVNVKRLMDAGYIVDAAEDGIAAWSILRQNNYDLIITDNTMPRMTGLELIDKVRAAGMAVAVMMASGTVPTEQFSRYPWLRPDATLSKPYTAVTFLETVKKVLARPSP
ncbi:MAG: response regulator [Limisphaerales bacterium]